MINYNFENVKEGDLFKAKYPDGTLYYHEVVIIKDSLGIFCFREYLDGNKKRFDTHFLNKCNWELGAKNDYIPREKDFKLSENLIRYFNIVKL